MDDFIMDDHMSINIAKWAKTKVIPEQAYFMDDPVFSIIASYRHNCQDL